MPAFFKAAILLVQSSAVSKTVYFTQPLPVTQSRERPKRPVRSLQPFFQLLHDVSVQRPNWRTDWPGKVGGRTRLPGFRFPTRQPHTPLRRREKWLDSLAWNKIPTAVLMRMECWPWLKCRLMAAVRILTRLPALGRAFLCRFRAHGLLPPPTFCECCCHSCFARFWMRAVSAPTAGDSNRRPGLAVTLVVGCVMAETILPKKPTRDSKLAITGAQFYLSRHVVYGLFVPDESWTFRAYGKNDAAEAKASSST